MDVVVTVKAGIGPMLWAKENKYIADNGGKNIPLMWQISDAKDSAAGPSLGLVSASTFQCRATTPVDFESTGDYHL